MALSAYTAVQNWADDAKWTDAVMDAFVDNLETWIADNVVALCPDKTGIESISGNWTFSGNNVFSGTELHSGTGTWGGTATFTNTYTFSGNGTFQGTNTFSGNNTHSGTNTFSGNNTFAGTNTFSGSNTFSSANTFSATNIFSVDQRINDGIAFVDANSNEYLQFEQTASAVNEFSITNAAAGNPPELAATGDDTNINIKLSPKGTGVVTHGAATLLRTDTAQTVEVTTANITLGTTDDGAYADVTGVTSTFTVGTAGKYLAVCNFSHSMSIATGSSVYTNFKLTDSTNDSAIVVSGITNPDASSAMVAVHPVSITFAFTLTAGSKTIKLQKYTDGTAGTVSYNVLNDNRNTPTEKIVLQIFRIAD